MLLTDVQTHPAESLRPTAPAATFTVWVTGAGGLLGTAVLAALQQAGHRAIPHCRSQTIGTVPGFALEQLERIEPAVANLRPDWIIHAAGNTNLDACEADQVAAERLHVTASAALARAAARHGSRLLYVSTDAVYDGEISGAHAEDEPTCPVNHYARTKRAGEQACLVELPSTVVARVNFFGLHPTRPGGLAAWLVENLRAGRAINGFTDVLFNPLLNHDLAALLTEATRHDLPGGIYNFGAADACSKHQFALQVAARLGVDASLVRPAVLASAALATARPRNTVMDTRKLAAALGRDLPDITSGLNRLFPS